MGKVYQFPSNQAATTYNHSPYSESKSMMQHMIYLLIHTYQERMDEISHYKEDIKTLDGTQAHSTYELLQLVNKANELFLKYGISSNYHRFVTPDAVEILYYNDTHLFHVSSLADYSEMTSYTPDEFMSTFTQNLFTFILDDSVYHLLDEQVHDLQATITTLSNTQV